MSSESEHVDASDSLMMMVFAKSSLADGRKPKVSRGKSSLACCEPVTGFAGFFTLSGSPQIKNHFFERAPILIEMGDIKIEPKQLPNGNKKDLRTAMCSSFTWFRPKKADPRYTYLCDEKKHIYIYILSAQKHQAPFAMPCMNQPLSPVRHSCKASMRLQRQWRLRMEQGRY